MVKKTISRTIFILDSHPLCKEQSTQCDEYSKNLPQRSIWSCFIESVHEYCRIFYDLFDCSDSMLSIHISNGTSNDIINNWNENEQQAKQISKGLLSINQEKNESKRDRIKNSVIQALENLLINNEKYDKINGRIILLLLDNSIKLNENNNKNTNNIFSYYENKNDIYDIRDMLVSAWEESKNKNSILNDKLDDCIFDIIKVSDSDDEYVNNYTQDTYYYQVNDEIILSVYHSPILKILNSIRNLIQLQKNLYTLTISDIPIKIDSENNNSYSISLLYTGNGHIATSKRDKKRIYESNYFSNRTTFTKWRSVKPKLKNNNSTMCIHKITPMDISNDITNLFINAILTNNTFFYFVPCEEKSVSWNKDQPKISHMIYFDKGNLLLACIDSIRPNIINLPALPKIKEVCKLSCEDFEDIIESSTIDVNVPIKSNKDIESLFFKNKEDDYFMFKPYEHVSNNRLRELSFIENPKDFEIKVPKMINKLSVTLKSIDEKSPVYIGEPAKLLKPFIDNYINEELNENIMISIRSALKILTMYYNENNKSLFPSISNKYKRKILYDILIRDLRQIGEKYKDNSDSHKTIYNYIEKHFCQDNNDSSNSASRPSTPSKFDQDTDDSSISTKKGINRLSNSTNSRTVAKNSRNMRIQPAQPAQPQSRLRTSNANAKPPMKESVKIIPYLIVNKPSDEEIQNDKERKDNGKKGSLFNLYWNNKKNQRSILMTYLNNVGGYGWKLENRDDFYGRNGLNLDLLKEDDNGNSGQDSGSLDNAKSSSSLKSNHNMNYSNDNMNSSNSTSMNSNNRNNHGYNHGNHFHNNNNMNSSSNSSSIMNSQKDVNNSTIKHANKKVKL
ncbi:hypothetical protein BCR36DRAFT_315087 [Piromyces finnis]|uniref:Uncharacterized protein n=1 Tax=Piromyces finnis TaxID=1754191 RepID=A0A1Y1VPB5_9FUNG|nr:hypothetical protein BCR36DRAFT_315087 [Piromyces finnis]|eukprot:ORX60992.1 hypothetical protein BCR36DRAFT_315087 [Piromyces finnis]